MHLHLSKGLTVKKVVQNYPVSYEKLFKKLRKRRIRFSSFAKQAGLTEEDVYAIEIGTFMTLEGEIRACIFLECDMSDIREFEVPPGQNERRRRECEAAGIDLNAPREQFKYERFL